jgi:hypothetical protein
MLLVSIFISRKIIWSEASKNHSGPSRFLLLERQIRSFHLPRVSHVLCRPIVFVLFSSSVPEIHSFFFTLTTAIFPVVIGCMMIALLFVVGVGVVVIIEVDDKQ